MNDSFTLIRNKTNDVKLNKTEVIMNAREYFIKNYFDEMRDSQAYLQESMVKSQLEAILQVIMDLCESYKISFYPFFGTLLGTIRHKGFVPWDNDVDIVLMRDDYESFIELAKKELEYPYELIDLSKSDKGYRGSYCRIVKVDTTAMSLDHNWGKMLDEGIHVDIIPLDYTYNEAVKENEKVRQIRRCQHLIRCKIYNFHEVSDIYKLKEYRMYQDEAFDNSLKDLHNRLHTLFTSGDKDSQMLGIYTTNRKKNRCEKYILKDFSETVDVGFNKMRLKVPIGYDRILKIRYGNRYMEYPPISKRTSKTKYFYDTSTSYKIYQRRFFGVFDELEQYEYILFGAGYMSLDYLRLYGKKLLPSLIIDNDQRKWGKSLEEISYPDMNLVHEKLSDIDENCPKARNIVIESPKKLREIDTNKIRLIICSSYFKEIEIQLKEDFGLDDYYIYVQEKNDLINSM